MFGTWQLKTFPRLKQPNGYVFVKIQQLRYISRVQGGCSSVYIVQVTQVFVMLCAIWYHLYNLKNVQKHTWKSFSFSKVTGFSKVFRKSLNNLKLKASVQLPSQNESLAITLKICQNINSKIFHGKILFFACKIFIFTNFV